MRILTVIAIAAAVALPAFAQSTSTTNPDGITAPPVAPCVTTIPAQPTFPDGANRRVNARDMAAAEQRVMGYLGQVQGAVACERLSIAEDNARISADLEAFNARARAFTEVGNRWKSSAEAFNARLPQAPTTTPARPR
jgi:hypothetical protein